MPTTEITDGLHIVKLTTRRNNCAATLPKELCEEIGARAGRDHLLVGSLGDAILVFKAESIDPEAVGKEFDRKVDKLVRGWHDTYKSYVEAVEAPGTQQKAAGQ